MTTGTRRNLKIQIYRFELSLLRILALVGLLLSAAILSAAAWHWTHPLPKLRDVRRWADDGQWDRADLSVRQFLARRPKDGEALLLAARIAAGRGDMESCLSLLHQVPTDSPHKPEALTRQAQACQAMNSARRAEAAWRELARLRERDPQQARYRLAAQAELVALMSLERRLTEAEALLWQMYPDHSEKWRILIGLARVHARGSTPKSAIEMLQRFVEHDPDDFDARRALSFCAIDTFQWDQAIELATTCLEQQPTDVRSLEILLECYLRQQQWEAMDAILARPELENSGVQSLRLRAQRLEAVQQADEAENCYRQALRLDPRDHTTHYQLSQLLQRLGRGEPAQEHMVEFRRLKEHDDELAKFISRFPQSDASGWTAPEPDQCVELAEHCTALGRIDEARAWLKEALRRQPKFPAAQEALQDLP